MNLANALPDMLAVTSSVSYESKLGPCVTALVRDKSESVREAMVLRIVEVGRRLGSSESFRIINDYCAALADESPQVISHKRNSNFLKNLVDMKLQQSLVISGGYGKENL